MLTRLLGWHLHEKSDHSDSMSRTRSASKATVKVASPAPVSPRKRSAPPTPATPTKKGKATQQAIVEIPASASKVTGAHDTGLLHPGLSFNYQKARLHYESLDSRWKGLFDAIKCKPFEGDQVDAVFDPWRSLTTSILGQQVSWLAARSITHKFVRLFYPHLPEKLASPKKSTEANVTEGATDHYVPTENDVFPSPSHIVALANPIPTLRTAGLSQRKAEYVLELAQRFDDGRLSAKGLMDMNDEEVAKTLIEIRGIGRWTVDMFLIFTLKRPDILPVGDLGIQKGLCKWYSTHGAESAPTIHPVKLAVRGRTPAPVEEEGEMLPPPTPSQSQSQSQQAEPPATPTPSQKMGNPYPDARSPTLETLNATGVAALSSQVFEELPPATPSASFPETSGNLTPAAMKSRLGGKKLKGNVYLTPQEMDELTSAWRPYRSVGVWYLWSLLDGETA